MGDMLTLWGFDAASDSVKWDFNLGANGYQGTTLSAQFGTAKADALVTFAGTTTENARFSTSNRSIDGLSYLAVTRIAYPDEETHTPATLVTAYG